MVDLSGPRLKLSRAKHHLTELNAALLRWAKSKPYTLVLEPAPEPPTYLLRVRVNRKLPTDSWGVIVGDFTHDARSALDLLVYQLSTLPALDHRRRKLQFPICDTPAEYANCVERRLCGVSDAARTIIEWTQPYNECGRRLGDALQVLRDISNTDKHRLIPVVLVVARLANFTSTESVFAGLTFSGDAHIGIDRGTGGLATYEGVKNPVIIEDGAIVAKLSVTPNADIVMQPEMTAIVQFGKAHLGFEDRDVTPILWLIGERVEEIIGKF